MAISPRSSACTRQRATEVLGLVAHLKQEKLCVESYQLFLTIMANVESDDWLWRPAELSLIGAFQWGIPRPHVGDPASLIRFLEHCLIEQARDIGVDDSVERTMLALAGAPAEVVGDGIARVDFTQPLFFNGICHALRNGAPYPLRRATVTFLRHLDAQLFDHNKTFTMDQVNSFISGWSSSAHETMEKENGRFLTESLFGMLMGLLDSPFWREHIPQDRWCILTLLGGMTEERIPPSFYRCVKNPTIVPYLKQVDPHGVNVLAQWAAILWAKYPDLSQGVRSQVENETRNMASGQSSKDNLSSYLTIVEGQIQLLRDRIKSHAWSFGEDVAELRKRLDSLRAARGTLIAIQKIPL